MKAGGLWEIHRCSRNHSYTLSHYLELPSVQEGVMWAWGRRSVCSESHCAELESRAYHSESDLISIKCPLIFFFLCMEKTYKVPKGRKLEGLRWWASVGERNLDLQRKTERWENEKDKRKRHRESCKRIFWLTSGSVKISGFSGLWTSAAEKREQAHAVSLGTLGLCVWVTMQ